MTVSPRAPHKYHKAPMEKNLRGKNFSFYIKLPGDQVVREVSKFIGTGVIVIVTWLDQPPSFFKRRHTKRDYARDGQWQIWVERWMINMCCKSGIQIGYLPTDVANAAFVGTAPDYNPTSRRVPERISEASIIVLLRGMTLLNSFFF